MYQHSTVYHSNTDHDYVSIIISHKLNTLFFFCFFLLEYFIYPYNFLSVFFLFLLCVWICLYVFWEKKFYDILFIWRLYLTLLWWNKNVKSICFFYLRILNLSKQNIKYSIKYLPQIVFYFKFKTFHFKFIWQSKDKITELYLLYSDW